MRLGEVKNILSAVIDDKEQIFINNNPIFGGLAYSIINFQELVEAYDVIKVLPWNDTDNSQLGPIIDKYRNSLNPVQVEQAEFNIINSYFSSINQKFSLYFSILKSTTEKQDEKIINIKLPKDIDSFSDLNEINKRLDDALKLFNVDGEFKFKGFDKGTDWYLVLAIGTLSYNFIISCLDIAKKYLEVRTEWFNSEEARISFETAKKTSENLTKDKFEDEWLSIYLKDKIKEVINEIGETNGSSKAELQSKLIQGTTKLIKELGEGTEFHLSLNPPSYAVQTNGSLIIDYKKIRQIREKERAELGEDKTKALKSPETSEEAEAAIKQEGEQPKT